jgi:serine/threonine-protein kinase
MIEGRYRLERQLGTGAMGEVWLARDLELDRDVAIKLLAPHADRARFEREARASAALSDPNVTRLYDYGETDGRPFIVLEYLPGGTLEDRLSRGHPLPDNETAAIAAQLATGLAHAHENGLVHRDLKPANILFDVEGRPKISDFGIASVVGASTLTDEGTVLGTAAYISPEQANGESATAASDVYAFGVILFRMLTGRLPFESDSALELADMHRRLDAPPVERLRPDARADLAAVTQAALARDPRLRPADGTALVNAFRAPAAAPPAPTDGPTLLLRRPSRSRRPLALAGGALLLAVAGTATALLLSRESSGGQPHPLPTFTRHTSTAATSVATSSSSATATSTTTPATTTNAVTTAPPVTTTAPPETTTMPPTTAADTTTTAPAP